MTNSQRLANVRTALNHWLENQVGAGVQISSGSESIVIRGGFYCGRRFSAPTHHAIWFVEEDELKIYDSDTRLVCSMQCDEIDRWAATASPAANVGESTEPHRENDAPQRRAA